MAVKLKHIRVTVSSAGTAVQVSSTSLRVSSATIMADPDNAGKIHVSDENVASSGDEGAPLSANGALVLEAPDEKDGTPEDIDLSKVYIDAADNGSSAIVLYYERIPNT